MKNMSFMKNVLRDPFLLNEFIKIMDSEVSLPNIKLPTMGGEVWWSNLVEYNGLKLQQHDLTKHCRLLDSNNVRIAWGTKNGMIKALDTLHSLNEKYQKR